MSQETFDLILAFVGLAVFIAVGVVMLAIIGKFNDTLIESSESWAPKTYTGKKLKPYQGSLMQLDTTSTSSSQGLTSLAVSPRRRGAARIQQKPRRASGHMSRVTSRGQETLQDGLTLPTPQEIYDAMGEYVIGQEEARRTLAVAVYNHYKRITPAWREQQATKNARDSSAKSDDGKENSSLAPIEIAKSNILLLGPTGSGKTLMVQTLARILDVPLAIADATSLTDAGFIGDDVESVLGRLVMAAGSIERAEIGIVYIDEFDKIARSPTAASSLAMGDPSGEGVQQALLKLLEGSIATLPYVGSRRPHIREAPHIDTTHILFICGGAFVGLPDIVRKRCSHSGVGFSVSTLAEGGRALNDDELLDQVEPQDLLRYGFIPEIIGRIPVITHTASLDAASLVRILTEPRNALISQYQELLAYDGVQLEFDPDALEAIAEQALARGTGARGLRSICEGLLRDVMFELPSRHDVERVVVHRSCVSEGVAPELVLRESLER